MRSLGDKDSQSVDIDVAPAAAAAAAGEQAELVGDALAPAGASRVFSAPLQRVSTRSCVAAGPWQGILAMAIGSIAQGDGTDNLSGHSLRHARLPRGDGEELLG